MHLRGVGGIYIYIDSLHGTPDLQRNSYYNIFYIYTTILYSRIQIQRRVDIYTDLHSL